MSLPEREHPVVLTDIHPFKWLSMVSIASTHKATFIKSDYRE